MRIEQRDLTLGQARRLFSEIAEAAQCAHPQGRVCGESCSLECGHCSSKACHCLCSPACPGAPRGLSSCPDQYPIEPKILPLVFEMKRWGFFTPCWSCEGHLRSDGRLWKVPRVWFFCESVILLRLLSSGVAAMKIAERLNAAWQVVVVHSAPDNPQTTFSLEPDAAAVQDLRLSDLHDDVAALARSHQSMMSAEARALLDRAGCLLKNES